MKSENEKSLSKKRPSWAGAGLKSYIFKGYKLEIENEKSGFKKWPSWAEAGLQGFEIFEIEKSLF